MPQPMIGPWKVRLNASRPFTIHGDQYFEFHVSDLSDQTDHIVRVPQHAIATPPTPGQEITLTVLMGQITGVSSH